MRIKMKNKVFFAIFITVWLLLAVGNLLAPKKDFSEEENRYLAKAPSFSFEKLINGQYAQQWEEYINDHFIARNEWVTLKSTVDLAIGKTEINDIYIGKDGYLFQKEEPAWENLEKATRNHRKIR